MNTTVDIGTTLVPEDARSIIVAGLALAGVAALLALLAQGRGAYLLLTLLGATPRRRFRELSQPLPRAERDWTLVSRLDTRALRRTPLILRLLAPVGRLVARLWAPAGRALSRLFEPVAHRARAAARGVTRPLRVRLRAWRLRRAEARVVRQAERVARQDERERAKREARDRAADDASDAATDEADAAAARDADDDTARDSEEDAARAEEAPVAAVK